MDRCQRKSKLAFLVMLGILSGLVGAGLGFAEAGTFDHRLLGKWSRVTDVVAEGITLRPDGTFQILNLSYYRNFRTVWRNVTVGKYKVEGDKITFYDRKISTTSKAGVVRYTLGEYEMLKEQERTHRVNERLEDRTLTFKVMDPDTVMFGDEEFKSDKK